jgi:hypothetical protein
MMHTRCLFLASIPRHRVDLCKVLDFNEPSTTPDQTNNFKVSNDYNFKVWFGYISTPNQANNPQPDG